MVAASGMFSMLMLSLLQIDVECRGDGGSGVASRRPSHAKEEHGLALSCEVARPGRWCLPPVDCAREGIPARGSGRDRRGGRRFAGSD
uniref:Secreted protein n=1 Tax=Arundo donax TaxID=35708 RepID=A0A0A9D9Y7_ARUDO